MVDLLSRLEARQRGRVAHDIDQQSNGHSGDGNQSTEVEEPRTPKHAKVLSKPFHLKDLVDEVEKLLAA